MHLDPYPLRTFNYFYALYLPFFTQELKIREFWMSCCACPLCWTTILCDRYIPIQTLKTTLLRNVMLTVPKGAWATCAKTSEHLHRNIFSISRHACRGCSSCCNGLNGRNGLPGRDGRYDMEQKIRWAWLALLGHVELTVKTAWQALQDHVGKEEKGLTENPGARGIKGEMGPNGTVTGH